MWRRDAVWLRKEGVPGNGCGVGEEERFGAGLEGGA